MNRDAMGELDEAEKVRHLIQVGDAFEDWLKARAAEPINHWSESSEQNWSAGDGEGYLWTFVGMNTLHLVLRTDHGTRHETVRVAKDELTAAVSEYATVLRNPHRAYRDLGRRLSKLVLDPVAEKLKDDGVQRLLVWWDVPLRPVPFEALVQADGRFVAQTMASTILTSPLDTGASSDTEVQPATIDPDAEIVGFGVTAGALTRVRSLPALPGVRDELSAIVRTSPTDEGVRVGTVFLDDDFTASRVMEAWAGDAAILHFATHFVLEQDGTESYLLLGGGETLSLSQIEKMLPSTPAKDFLVFSACDTSVIGSDPDGIPIDSLASWAVLRGARNVVATHWQVDDVLAAEFMERLHAALVQGYDIPEAIRQSQLALLEPTETVRVDPGAERGVKRVHDSRTEDSKHPYYWAAFTHFR